MGLIRAVANSPTPPQGGAARMLWGLMIGSGNPTGGTTTGVGLNI